MMCSINQRSRIKAIPIFICFYSLVMKSYVHDSSFQSVESTVSLAACVSQLLELLRADFHATRLPYGSLRYPNRSCEATLLLPTTSDQINANVARQLRFQKQPNKHQNGVYGQSLKNEKGSKIQIHLTSTLYLYIPIISLAEATFVFTSTVSQVPQELRTLRYSRAL